MMSTCHDVNDDLADLVVGDRDAIARHAEHLATCDACRDLRHEASELAVTLGKAGDDYVPPANLATLVLAKLDATDAGNASTVAIPVAAKAPEPAPAKKPAETTVTPIRRSRALVAAGAIAALAAGTIGILATFRGDDDATTTTTTAQPGPLAGSGGVGTLATVARAAADGADGVSVRTGDAWRALKKGEVIPAGASIKTDERTRAQLALADGTELVLDHGTEVAFDAREPRTMTMMAGRLSADVAHVANRPASIATPSGTIDVIGTKLVVTATPTLTSVQVVRGSVALATTAGGRRETIHAGEEGVIENGALSIGAAPSLANELAWSELTPPAGQPTDDEVTAGLGALRAYKPGEKRDRDWKLALAKHDVKVRIVGPIARTEITETFRNDSNETLEGVYQFPLPPDAQIDGLQLDDPAQPGAFIEGAFLAKDRAQKIWQGVIDKATPQQIARPESEIIWVPGRWRDPALLNWQRGGRFELKIFPIPSKGARTIKLSYTQVVSARGPFRQYIYPLAHSKDGSTVADNFTVDVEVRGAQKGLVRTVGYPMTPDANRPNVDALTLTSSGFVPKGDLVVDYRAIDGDAELRAWTFAGGAAVAPDDKIAAKKGVGIDPKVIEAQRLVAADARPTAVLALRPALARWRETKPRDYTIVVDASQSMVGERWTRATELAASIVDQMDRRDRFTIAACDSECRRMGDLRAPAGDASKAVRAWLGGQAVAGASDLVASIRSAASTPPSPDRDRWVLYIGDGFATTGFRRAGDVERALVEVADAGVQVTTIGIGGDADRALLSAAARGGGGSYLAWLPGQTVSIAALSALESTNGASLRNATVELPAGLQDVAPTVLPTLRSGEEVLIAARITGDVKGDVIVRGKVGGQDFEQKYPLDLEVSSAAGNGFVPRLWASLAIEQMERDGDGDHRLKTIALSQAYGVMSKETSLLVLESQAMFDAFGVDRTQPTAKWTGEEALDEVVATGALDVASNGAGKGMASGGGFDKADRAADAPATVTATPPAPAKPAAPMKEQAEEKAKKSDSRAARGRASLDDGDLAFGAGVGMVAMRRTWVRVPSVSPYDGVSPRITDAVTKAEAALAASPDSREKHRALVQALAYAGEIERARDVANRWLERDKLDPQALGYLADLLGRDGQREIALRTLAGLVDLDADRAALHERMVRAYETVGRLSQACSHRIALAALSPKDANVAGSTMRCLRAVGRDRDAALIARALPDDATRANAEKAAMVSAPERKVAGDLVVNATWTGSADLDLTIVTPAGERISWMGGRTDVTVADTTSTEKERLALRSIKKGNYLIEISRGDGAPGAVRGSVEVTVLGTKRTLPFELLGARTTVGRLAITLEERMEQFSNFGMVPAPPQAAVGFTSTGDAALDRVVRARADVFRACYQRVLSREPGLTGRLDVTLTIDANGTVRDAMVGGSAGTTVAACVETNVRRLRFAPTTAQTVQLQMVFSQR